MAQRPGPETDEPAPFGAYQAPAALYKGVATQSVYIPMRDGVKLAAEVVLPKSLPPGARIPALLSQTRYWRAVELKAPLRWFMDPEKLDRHFGGFRSFFTGHGYGLLIVDVRGTGASFGTWAYPWCRESFADAGQIVDWIVAQPWSNGQVGGYGISYLGTTAELLAGLNHPAVKAAIPMFNHPDAYTDAAFPGGVFDERFIKAWGDMDQALDRNQIPQVLGLVGRLLANGVKPVGGDGGREQLQAAVRDHAANGHPYHLARVVECRDDRTSDGAYSIDDIAVHRFSDEMEHSETAIFGWGSWMDGGTADAVIRRFLTYDNAQRAVIGAWDHGGRFHASPYQRPGRPPDPILPDQWGEMLRFFDAHLKDTEDKARSEKVLFYYTMGEERWKRTAVWPPAGTATQRWYLAEDHSLSLAEPGAESGADRYAVDFEASTGPYNRWWEMGGLVQKTVIYSDRKQAGRHLLTYTSPPLAEDTEITGHPVVTLYLSSTETDGAVFVYLEDVDEAGQVTYVTEGQLRLIHRRVSTDSPPYRLLVPYHSFKREDAAPLMPGQIAEIKFGLLPTSVLIKKGHRIRIGIAGHDAGNFARIPAQGTPVITVARNRIHASHIDLPVV